MNDTIAMLRRCAARQNCEVSINLPSTARGQESLADTPFLARVDEWETRQELDRDAEAGP